MYTLGEKKVDTCRKVWYKLDKKTRRSGITMINRERLLNTFLDYVQISSESRHEAAFARRLKADLEALGLEVYEDDTKGQTGSDAGNLYATLPGNRAGEPLILCAHMDTVPPGNGVVPIVEDGVIRSSGDTVLGGDDKSAVAGIMETLRVILEHDLPHPDLQLVFTVCEEIGLRGGWALDFDRLIAKRAVIFDSVGDVGKIVNRGPGHSYLEATVVGRSAHAGMAPEDGISAVHVLCEAVANMKLSRIDEETTANVGTIRADFEPNVVAERAYLHAECRSLDLNKLRAQEKHMMDCLHTACDKYGAKLEGGLLPCFIPFAIPEEDPLVQQVIRACGQIGVPYRLSSTGGGSDAHVFNMKGIKALILSTGMDRVHTVREQLTIKNLEDTARWALALATSE